MKKGLIVVLFVFFSAVAIAQSGADPEIRIVDWVATSSEFDLKIIVENGFNTPRTVKVGFDIADPEGKRKEAVFRDVTISGKERDTIGFRTKITGTERFRYTAENPCLYTVRLSLAHEGRQIELVPFKFGFGTTTFDGTHVLRDGVPLKIALQEVDFEEEKGAAEQLRALKKQGINTIEPTRQQPEWFYDLAEQLGIWVIDRADAGPNTWGNDPTRLDYFLDAQRAMFYRNRGRANIIGWSIGSDCGNGFCMYRSYLLLKELDPDRPVVYRFAEGEWNTDL